MSVGLALGKRWWVVMRVLPTVHPHSPHPSWPATDAGPRQGSSRRTRAQRPRPAGEPAKSGGSSARSEASILERRQNQGHRRRAWPGRRWDYVFTGLRALVGDGNADGLMKALLEYGPPPSPRSRLVSLGAHMNRAALPPAPPCPVLILPRSDGHLSNPTSRWSPAFKWLPLATTGREERHQ